MDVTELIRRVRLGDPAAERALYDAHVDRIYRLAYRMTGEEDLARECTQETFIRAFERIGQFRGDAAFGTWLFSIAHTVVLNMLRKVKRFRLREVDLEHAATMAGNPRAPDPDLKDRLREAIDRLPHKYRLVFVMHDVEGYTHDEIAASLGMQPGRASPFPTRSCHLTVRRAPR